VIATKVYGRMRPGRNAAGLSRRAIMSEIDASLWRLGTDYVDLYQRCSAIARTRRSASSGGCSRLSSFRACRRLSLMG
jgi:aryl-alcohol dehydrogenase-like predicted oxidoreductase